MPTDHRTRLISAPQQRVWETVSDPHHMPRWWPGVDRVEGVADERFTHVYRTKRGRPIRADFRLIDSRPPWLCAWTQEIAGTPFARVLNELVVEVRLEPVEGATQVTIAEMQKLRGYSRTGGFMMRRATRARLDRALDRLEEILR
ncbi:MAG: SRPBCC family protein [Solirubrobacteraceae bacterium]